MVMMPRGLGSLFGLVLAGKLSGKMDPRIQIAIGFASTAYSAYLFSTFTRRCRHLGVHLCGVLQRHRHRHDFRAADGGVILDPVRHSLRTEASTFTSLLRNYGSGIGVSIVISVLSRTQATSHAYMAEQALARTAKRCRRRGCREQWDPVHHHDGLRHAGRGDNPPGAGAWAS
jgi:DHA2 family multidrug resistance protein